MDCPSCNADIHETKPAGLVGNFDHGHAWATMYITCPECNTELFIPLSGNNIDIV